MKNGEHQEGGGEDGSPTDWLDVVIEVHDLAAGGPRAKKRENRRLGVRHDPATRRIFVTISCRYAPMWYKKVEISTGPWLALGPVSTIDMLNAFPIEGNGRRGNACGAQGLGYVDLRSLKMGGMTGAIVGCRRQ